jgi:hypothetical protein
MKNWFAIIVLIGCLPSCLKKVEGADELNTNIFDREYAGDIWFVITDAYSFINDSGLPRVRVEAMIPASNMPTLTPTIVQLQIDVNGQDSILFNAGIDEDGNYAFYYDAVPATPGNYCLTAGIYVQEDGTVINSFTACTSL